MAKTKKKVAEMTESEEKERIIDYIMQCHKEAKDAARDRRKAWRELWDVYQNKQDYRQKQSWQAKIFAPKAWMKVERAAAEVKRALLQINKLFKFDIDDSFERTPEEKDALIEQMPAVEAKFKRAVAKTNLANVYSVMCKPAFLLGIGVPKVLWDYDRNCLNYQNVQALNTYVSPDFMVYEDERPKYLIEEQDMDLAAFKSMAKKVNEAAGYEIYDWDEIDRLDEDFKDIERKQAEQKTRGLGQYKDVSKRVLLWQFWGDIIDEKTNTINENQLCVLVNKKYLVRHQSNPFDHKKVPHLLTFPLPYPHRGIAGTSLVEPMVKILYTYNNLINMYVDNLNWSVNKSFEYNPSSLANPKSILTLYPGKLIQKNVNDQVMYEVPVSPVGKDAIPGLEFLDRETQEATSVTEFLMSMPSRKAKTLGEVEIKTAESKGLFDTIARDLEQNSIKPLLEMSYSLLVQFSDFDPIEGKYVIKVGGLSLMLIQKEQVEQVQSVIEIAARVPEFVEMTDMGELWKKFLGIMNLQDVYIEEEDRQGLIPEQAEEIERKAQLDARKLVARMSPEEIMKRAG
jgi:hypothetical protein